MLLQKMHDRRPPALNADFLGFEVEDRYVFGAGLDYKGYFRQLPAIQQQAQPDIDLRFATLMEDLGLPTRDAHRLAYAGRLPDRGSVLR